jgi:release factor glutamine methyltransferase
MPTLAQRLADATKRLASVTETPRLDAEILLAHALGMSRSQLLARLSDRPDVSRFGELVERRLAYEPLAYILGEWEFFSLTFKTPPPLLVPRPETEHLVECVLDHMRDRAAHVLDLCAGTGCVAIAVGVNAPHARVTATDTNPFALEVTRYNARRHGVVDRVEVRQGDLFDALRPARTAWR